MDPLVSIITPTYNHEPFISECIQSVLAQTYSNWEMLIINDGSTDNTAEIIKRYSDKDSRIKLYNQDNVGIFELAETYNFALNLSRGKYIAILEGDDIWQPDKLIRQVEKLEADESLILAWGVANLVDAGNNNIYYSSPDPHSEEAKYFFNHPVGSILNVLFFKNCLPALTIMIRKSALNEIGGFKQGYNLPLIDLPTIQELSAKGSFYFDEVLLGSWRIYPEQTTKKHVAAIVVGFRELTINNYNRFRTLPGITSYTNLKHIDENFKRLLIIAYSRDGRYKLIRGEYRAARLDYLKSLYLPGGEYMWKFRSLIGLTFSVLHLNVEGLARILGRPTYIKKEPIVNEVK